MLFAKKETVVHTIFVEGMMCPRCVAHVKDALLSVKGVTDASVSLEEKSATVTALASTSIDTLRSAIVSAGYEVK